MSADALPTIPSDRGDDLHNFQHASECDLILFMAGNQFMALPPLLAAFQQRHPSIARIVYQTLPPGLELKQILKGGATFQGEKLSVYPDIYTSVNRNAMEQLETDGHIEPGQYQLYLHNRLTLMVPENNPANIVSVQDLGRDEVRISQPDPENEDIGHHIVDMYRQAGGEALVNKIMEEKRAEGTTILTQVHHRETPLRIAKGTVDVGPVWNTEVIHARATGVPFQVVEPGSEMDQREHINYYICRLKKGAHPHNAEAFLQFINSKEARTIYERHGFIPPR